MYSTNLIIFETCNCNSIKNETIHLSEFNPSSFVFIYKGFLMKLHWIQIVQIRTPLRPGDFSFGYRFTWGRLSLFSYKFRQFLFLTITSFSQSEHISFGHTLIFFYAKGIPLCKRFIVLNMNIRILTIFCIQRMIAFVFHEHKDI